METIETILLMTKGETITVPKKGDRTIVDVLDGYVLSQNRPSDCRHACRCGTCNGHSYTVEGTVTNVISWAGESYFSYDLRVLCDDGVTRTRTIDTRHDWKKA